MRTKLTTLTAILAGLFLMCTGCQKSESVDDTGSRGGHDWPVFRGSPGLTGVSEEPLPEELILWFKLQAREGVSSSPVIGKGVIYVSTVDGRLCAFDLAARRKIWEKTMPDGFEASPVYVAEKNLLVTGSLDGFVTALAADSGRLVWEAETQARIMGSVNVYRGEDGVAEILAGSYDSSLYAFGLADGKRAWSFETGNYINGTAAVEGDRAVVGGCDANLHVFDLAWGKQLGAVDTGAYIAGSAAMKDGIAYVGNYAGRFLAIEVAELRVLWTFTLADERKGFTASPAVADKYIVIGAKDGFLYCLDRETGVQVWRYRGSDEYVSSPLAGGGRVLSVSADGESTLLELESGRVLSTYRIGATVHGSPALAHGYLAVAALDGNVYVFKGE